MLVLSRKVDQTIVIEGQIIIRIVEIKCGKVRLSIDAPRDILIDRGEVDDAKRKVPSNGH